MFKRISLIILILLVIFIGFLLFINKQIHGRVSDSNEEEIIEINSGEGVGEVALKLEKKGLISNALYFKIYIVKEGREDKIMTGEYSLRENMTIPEIVNTITSGKDMLDNEMKITIIEGWSNKKIAQYLEENGLVSEQEFNEETENIEKYKKKYAFLEELREGDTLEGFLFPDTYNIFLDSTAEEIVIKMLDNFQKKAVDLLKEIKNSQKSIKEIIIMASIIEREFSVKNEIDEKNQRIVSDIFWQRLDDGHPLQSCATVNYIIGLNKKQLSYDDTRIDSPYNTYINKGLPPGPISNPGFDAIYASLNPIESDYYYFLSDPQTGELIFSKTLEEHNQNKYEHGL